MDYDTGLREAEKVIRSLSYRHSTHDVWNGFLELVYCVFVNITHFPGSKRFNEIEERYEKEKARWGDKWDDHCKLLAIVTMAHGGRDFLGDLAGKLEALNAAQGQFFTPWPVCQLMTAMTISDKLPAKGYELVAEPASGGGAMVLAYAEARRSQGHTVGETMWVEATDVSPQAQKMTYIQLTLSGIPARVTWGNTLTMETWEAEFTMACETFLEKHGFPSGDKVRLDARGKPVRRRKRND